MSRILYPLYGHYIKIYSWAATNPGKVFMSLATLAWNTSFSNDGVSII